MSSPTPWEQQLHSASRLRDGCPGTFSPSSIPSTLLYRPSTLAYARMIRMGARDPPMNPAQLPSAGWIVPRDDASSCHPIFIAHSTLSAIWLLRETLGDDTLPASAWERLVHAATAVASHNQLEPTSTQPPPPSPVERPAKRPRLDDAQSNHGDEQPEDGVQDQALDGADDASEEDAEAGAKAGSSADGDDGEEASEAGGADLVDAADRAEAGGEASAGSDGEAEDATDQLETAGEPSHAAADDHSLFVPLERLPTPEPPIPSAAPVIPSMVPIINPGRANNTLRHHQKLAKKLERAAVARKDARRDNLGLVEPPANAPKQERLAYESIASQDEYLVSWIIKQNLDGGNDFYTKVEKPYHLAVDMLRRAREVGNPTSQRSAAAFFRAWRSHGSPFAASTPVPPTPTAPIQSTQSTLFMAWQMCDHYESEVDLIHIRYRWSLAYLGQKYVALLEELPTLSARVRMQRFGIVGGKLATVARNELLREAGVTFPKNQHARKRMEIQIGLRLSRARRWYEAVKILGWGMLCLLPHDVVTNSFAEQTLTTPMWNVWLRLVGQCNPAARHASQALGEWLGAQVTGPIDDKQALTIETNPPPSQVEEVLDSEDDDDEPTTQTSTRPRKMRQLTLLELCQPCPPSTQ